MNKVLKSKGNGEFFVKVVTWKDNFQDNSLLYAGFFFLGGAWSNIFLPYPILSKKIIIILILSFLGFGAIIGNWLNNHKRIVYWKKIKSGGKE